MQERRRGGALGVVVGRGDHDGCFHLRIWQVECVGFESAYCYPDLPFNEATHIFLPPLTHPLDVVSIILLWKLHHVY